MSDNDSAIDAESASLSARAHRPDLLRSGIVFGFLGVLAFSFTVPFTHVAVAGLDPVFVGSARAVVAAALAAAALAATRSRPPTRSQWGRLVLVAAGIVVGFPVLTSVALTQVSAGHSAVVIGLLPATTAVVIVLRSGERPPRRFWMWTATGAVAVVGFAIASHGTGVAGATPAGGDAYLIGAVVLAAVGYAEGGLLARSLGAWQTISWALVLAAPFMVALATAAAVTHPPHASVSQWSAFGYLAAVSMYLGFFAWYRGLALGPLTTVSQTQLVQPVLSVLWSATLLGEAVSATVIVGGLAVVVCATGAVRSRMRPATGPPASRPTGGPADTMRHMRIRQ